VLQIIIKIETAPDLLSTLKVEACSVIRREVDQRVAVLDNVN
jgi:hypothetical protein